MDSDGVSQWFGEILDAFAACGRGERDTDSLLAAYYGVPLLVTTDEGFFALTSDAQVVAVMRQQVDGKRGWPVTAAARPSAPRSPS